MNLRLLVERMLQFDELKFSTDYLSFGNEHFYYKWAHEFWRIRGGDLQILSYSTYRANFKEK